MPKNKLNNLPTELIKKTKEIIEFKSQAKKLILVRSVENIGSLSGCLNGWIDAKISDYGRKQAKYLSINYFAEFDNKKSFGNVYLSDLLRAKETADICLGHDFRINYKMMPELREIYFGENEGLFYDGLPKEEKTKMNKINHKFTAGESWMDVKYRCVKFIDQVIESGLNNNKVDLVFAHGGFMTSLLYSKNIKMLPPNGSVIIISLSNPDLIKENSHKLKSLVQEYSYNCTDEAFSDAHFTKYNPNFEEYLDKCIDKVETIYNLPDISEELL